LLHPLQVFGYSLFVSVHFSLYFAIFGLNLISNCLKTSSDVFPHEACRLHTPSLPGVSLSRFVFRIDEETSLVVFSIPNEEILEFYNYLVQLTVVYLVLVLDNSLMSFRNDSNQQAQQ
jgi:hypothetical protein